MAVATPYPLLKESKRSIGNNHCERYNGLHAWATNSFGKETVGRNVCKFGVPAKGADRVIAKQKFAVTFRRLKRWHNPAPVYATSSSTASSLYSGPSSYTAPHGSPGGGYVNSGTVQCESGGDYGINTGNGYYGGYQFDSQTWDAYGDPAYGEANEAPPAVQDQAAASVPYDAWPNC